MKYKLINKQTKEEHLCEKVTTDGFDYYVSDAYGKPAIATNNPNINCPKVVDDVEKVGSLAIQNSKKFSNSSETDYTIGFIHGYNKSQETHPFSDEDMIEFAWWLKENIGQFSCDRTAHFKGEYFKLWKKQQPKIVYYNE